MITALCYLCLCFAAVVFRAYIMSCCAIAAGGRYKGDWMNIFLFAAAVAATVFAIKNI